jgi:integration host factor subunit alpha
MNISARRVLTFKPSQILKEDITERYSHRLDESGTENTALPVKEAKPKALSSFLNNEDDTVYGDDIDDENDND